MHTYIALVEAEVVRLEGVDVGRLAARDLNQGLRHRGAGGGLPPHLHVEGQVVGDHHLGAHVLVEPVVELQLALGPEEVEVLGELPAPVFTLKGGGDVSHVY